MKYLQTALLPLVLFSVSFVLIANAMSFGAQGADALGYIFLTGRISHGQPLIFQESSIKVIQRFNEPRALDIALPKQYTLDLASGALLHNYPIGLPLLLSLSHSVIPKPLSWYVFYVVLCALAPPLLYLVMRELLPAWQSNMASALVAAGLLLTQTIFFSYAIGPPTRDLPLLTMILGTILLLLKVRNSRLVWWSLMAGVVFAMGISIRLTAVAFLPLCITILYQGKRNVRPALFFFTTLAVTIILLVGTHWQLDGQFVSLRHLLMPQFEQASTLSSQNIISAKGHYARGASTVVSFGRELLVNLFSTPYTAVIAIILGGLVLWQKRKNSVGLDLILGLWFLPYTTIFLFWSNAYPRYLLPVIPVPIIMAALLVEWIFQWLKKNHLFHSMIAIISVVLLFVVLQGQQLFLLARASDTFHAYHFERALTWSDYREIQRLQTEIINNTTNPLIITSGRDLRELADTLEAHTAIPVTPLVIDEFIDAENATNTIAALAKNYDIVLLSEDVTQDMQLLQLTTADKTFPSAACSFSFLSDCAFSFVVPHPDRWLLTD